MVAISSALFPNYHVCFVINDETYVDVRGMSSHLRIDANWSVAYRRRLHGGYCVHAMMLGVGVAPRPLRALCEPIKIRLIQTINRKQL